MLDFISNNAGIIAGAGGGGAILWFLKRVPNETICKYVEGVFCTLGKTLTLGMSKSKFFKKTWNKVIEPWFIDLIDNLVGGMVRGFIKGLRSDN